MNKKGFTLVELAIVIVIIGLIVGGVIGGQSLIESSKRQSVVREINIYQTTIKAFQLEYDALPGDMTDATDYWGQAGDGSASQCRTEAGTGTQTCNGDGDKTFDFTSTASDSRHEPWRAWEHLSNAGIVPDGFTGISNDSLCGSSNLCTDPGNNAPASKLGNGASWHLYYTIWNTHGKNERRNILALGSPSVAAWDSSTGTWLGHAISPADMKKIDDKVDDGKPNSGFMVNRNAITSVGVVDPNCTSASGSVLSYNLSYDDLACLMLIDID